MHLSYQASDAWETTVGLDWRTAEIAHFREVRDLLGGDYYIPAPGQYSDFLSSAPTLGLGDKSKRTGAVGQKDGRQAER